MHFEGEVPARTAGVGTRLDARGPSQRRGHCRQIHADDMDTTLDLRCEGFGPDVFCTVSRLLVFLDNATGRLMQICPG
jgi:hypothetical protein